MSLPKSYKAYAFTEKGGKLQPVTVSWKDPGENQVVLKVLACGVCAGDEVPKEQLMPTGLPRIPGHEIVGDIASIHPSVKAFKIGDRVGAGWHGGHCFNCEGCRSGDFVTCNQDRPFTGIFVDGGYAEYVTVRAEALVRIPEGLDPVEAAPLLCAGITTFGGLLHAGLKPGDTVAIQGIGGLGHLAIQFANKMGYRTIALSSSPSKREASLELGAVEYLDSSQVNQAAELQKLGGAKAILACAPNAESFRMLLGGLGNDGSLIILSVPHEEFKVSAILMIMKRLSIRAWGAGGPHEMEKCLEFSKQQGIKTLVETFPLDKAQEAFDRRSTARFRAVIVP